jgi:hypothetical protein
MTRTTSIEQPLHVGRNAPDRADEFDAPAGHAAAISVGAMLKPCAGLDMGSH